MEKTLKILAAVTGILVAVGEVMKQVNEYNASKNTTEDSNADITAEKK